MIEKSRLMPVMHLTTLSFGEGLGVRLKEFRTLQLILLISRKARSRLFSNRYTHFYIESKVRIILRHGASLASAAGIGSRNKLPVVEY